MVLFPRSRKSIFSSIHKVRDISRGLSSRRPYSYYSIGNVCEWKRGERYSGSAGVEEDITFFVLSRPTPRASLARTSCTSARFHPFYSRVEWKVLLGILRLSLPWRRRILHPPRPATVLAVYAFSLQSLRLSPPCSPVAAADSLFLPYFPPLALSWLAAAPFRREKSGANIISLLFRSLVFLWVREDIMYLPRGPLFAILVVSRGE